MGYRGRERRKYERYDMETEVHCFVDYDLVTRIEFWAIGKGVRRSAANMSVGICRNVSADGLRFGSAQRSKIRDKLFVKLYLPKSRKPILLAGQVRWSKRTLPYTEDLCAFDTGIKVSHLNGRLVAPTIHMDPKYGVPWSIVLDLVFGSFRKHLHNAMVRAKTHSPRVLLKGIKPE